MTALEELTGLPVRVEYRAPGVSDTLALSLINEAIRMGIPVVAMPFVNSALAAHPAFASSVERLRLAGVEVIFGPGEPRPAGGGGPFAEAFAWQLGLAALRMPGREAAR